MKKQPNKFPYRWNLSDGYPAKGIEYHGSKVFSCFACGGGSTMGYKLAGFDVVGCNEIDPKMMDCYIENHNPKYPFLMPIQEFKDLEELPIELYNLDILDGSPPCSSFSMIGNREKDWGKEKRFREGQSEQVLDTLFFDFIELAKRLQPKIVIAENVKGLIQGGAIRYCTKIRNEFDQAGYYVERWLLDSSKMGIPQKRERVFFVAICKKLADRFDLCGGLFCDVPNLDMRFSETEIPYRIIEDRTDISIQNSTKVSTFWKETKPGKSFSSVHPKGFFFGDNKAHPERPLNTIAADPSHGSWNYQIQRRLNKSELCLAGSYPSDYNFKEQKAKYLIGMSVPPVMVAQIAHRIKVQWLDKINQKVKV